MCFTYNVVFLLYIYFIVHYCKVISTPVPGTCKSEDTSKTTWRLEEYPNPKINISRCGRGCKSSWICDPDHAILSTEADELDQLIDKAATSTKCPCSNCQESDGYKISVAIVQNIAKSSKSNVTSDKDFAHYLRLKWHQSKCDNNLLILLVTKNMQAYTEVGTNTHTVLTNQCIQEVHDKVQSSLEDRKYFKFIHELITQYKIILTVGNCEYIAKDRLLTKAAIVVGSVGGLAVIFFLVLTLVRNKKGGCCYISKENDRRPHYHANNSYDGDEEERGRNTSKNHESSQPID